MHNCNRCNGRLCSGKGVIYYHPCTNFAHIRRALYDKHSCNKMGFTQITVNSKVQKFSTTVSAVSIEYTYIQKSFLSVVSICCIMFHVGFQLLETFPMVNCGTLMNPSIFRISLTYFTSEMILYYLLQQTVRPSRDYIFKICFNVYSYQTKCLCVL